MADDSDVPPLEDMTSVLKQAHVIREAKSSVTKADQSTHNAANAKERANVKKHVKGRAIHPEDMHDGVASGDLKDKSSISFGESAQSDLGALASTSTAPSQLAKSSLPSSKNTNKTSKGMFGGMKKGFLLGVPPKSAASAASKANNKSAQEVESTLPDLKKSPAMNEPKNDTPNTPALDTKPKDDIPYISPKTGTTESGLTLSEVQQAMSEAKGLLDNQDWITNDLLDKVEKDELLLKRFSDPHFMKALQEFQTNPTEAMEKYKGNKEVQKFMLEFCDLLGDHFSNIGNTSSSSGKASKLSQPSRPEPKISEIPDKSKKPPKPKIIEITDKSEDTTDLKHSSEALESSKKSSKITGSTETETSPNASSKMTKLKTPNSVSKSNTAEIKTRLHDSADIQEVPPMPDAEVEEILTDQKVMDILMDQKVMTLIQMLKSDPDKAQRMAEKADGDFKGKINFLVTKGLLKIQAG